MFYNCKSLTQAIINSFYVSDTREMFYNCISLNVLNFQPYYTNSQINMTKMFYNCNSIQSISIYRSSYYLYPNDMSYMFYNCTSLKSLTITYLSTYYTKHMTYMLYNCKSLIDITLSSSYFPNYEVVDMRGVFQNCESLTTLDLSTFGTPKVAIMWDMFKGCSDLKSLYFTTYFDTSKVTDMQSMFNGCSSLTSLDLSGFDTSNVQYMNKMFKDCINLKSVYLNLATSESLGTMQRMFYNCSSLKYLNIFRLIEDVQSINEILDGTPNDLQLCVNDEKNIPNIFKIIYDKQYSTRDCSFNCYGNYNRKYAEKTKQCCQYSLYDGNCYDHCPSRTRNTVDDITCYNFSCPNRYYTYDQNNCRDDIPYRFYMNDTVLRTIDKCDDNCNTCTNRSTKCLTCKSEKPYLYLSKCLNSCDFGSFLENGIEKCFCYDRKCKYCSEESMEYNLCETCSPGYFQKFGETFNNSFINCYKDPEGYYFDSSNLIYMPCYSSCKFCDWMGDKINHYCKSCNSKNTYPILMEDNENYMNCYPNCTFNFYIDEDYNHICLNTTGCPTVAPFLIDKTKQCVKKCNNKNKYIFRNTCFKECPIESTNYTNDTGFYCSSVCPFERPFEKVIEQICVDTCTIMERYYGLCVTNYEGDRSADVQNIVLIDIKMDIVDTFNYSFITNERNLVYEEKNIVYEITSTQCEYHDPRTTIIDLGECESLLKMYYGIDEDEPLYILKIDAHVEGKLGPKVEYEVYYPFNGDYLNQLDLTICEGIDIISSDSSLTHISIFLC